MYTEDVKRVLRIRSLVDVIRMGLFESTRSMEEFVINSTTSFFVNQSTNQVQFDLAIEYLYF